MSTKNYTKDEEIHLNVNGSVIKDQKQVAEVLVEHCATLADGIGGDVAECKALEDFKDHSCVQQIQQETDNGKQTIDVNPVTQGQVLAVLESLNSVWPSDWKREDRTMVYKKDDKLSKENYRPNTIVPYVNKIMEKLVGS